ncbi:MAG: SDR family NAD(P)-dependent oxidoreductase [Agarilytica sp.]
MQKTILITGSTDGIGLEAAKTFAEKGHHILLHGRDENKLKLSEKLVAENGDASKIETYLADLSDLNDVKKMAQAIANKHSSLDVLINNAGVFKTPTTITKNGLDIRFAVNTLAPFYLTQALLPLMKPRSRVVNLSSAAQRSVELSALKGDIQLPDDVEAYAQSKLAITMWTNTLAEKHKQTGPIFVSVNPGSLLATKMVQEGFGMPGNDINIGRDILVRAALSEDFEHANGKYFDNDMGQFADPHTDALDIKTCANITTVIEETIQQLVF